MDSPIIESLFNSKDVKSNYNQIIKTLSNSIEYPAYRDNCRVLNYKTDYTVEKLKQIKAEGNIADARKVSRIFYSSDSSFGRIVDHLASIFKYYYVLDLRGVAQNSSKKNLKNFNSALKLLDNLNIEDTFREITKNVLIDGAYFAYINKLEDGHITLTQLNPNFCRIRERSAYNTDVVQFDLSFFDTYPEKDRALLLKRFPEIVQSAYKNRISKYPEWVSLSPSEACAFSFDKKKPFPRLFDTLIDIVNYNDYKEIEKKKAENELSKILVQRFKMDEQNDLPLLLEEMAQMHEAAASILKDREDIDLITTLADDIDLLDIQEKTQVSQDNIQQMVRPKYEGAGISYELFGSTTATALERNLMNNASFIGQLLPQYSNWLSLLCYSQFSFNNCYPVVTLLPVTWYNEKEMVDIYLKNAQYGYSWVLPYVASGKRQSCLLDNLYLEQDVYNLKEKMVPLSSSFTTSSNPSDEGGRPPLDTREKSDKTIENIESK